MRCRRMGDFDLTPEEAETLGAIVKGDQGPKRSRSGQAELAKARGDNQRTTFIPTALGFDWYRRHMEKKHGGEKEERAQESHA